MAVAVGDMAAAVAADTAAEEAILAVEERASHQTWEKAIPEDP